MFLELTGSVMTRPGTVTLTELATCSEVDETGEMSSPPDPRYRHRFPAEIISYAVWLYHVFSPSVRDVELILAERGIVVSYEISITASPVDSRSSAPLSQNVNHADRLTLTNAGNCGDLYNNNQRSIQDSFEHAYRLSYRPMSKFAHMFD
jgi:hypothetical protein